MKNCQNVCYSRKIRIRYFLKPLYNQMFFFSFRKYSTKIRMNFYFAIEWIIAICPLNRGVAINGNSTTLKPILVINIKWTLNRYISFNVKSGLHRNEWSFPRIWVRGCLVVSIGNHRRINDNAFDDEIGNKKLRSKMPKFRPMASIRPLMGSTAYNVRVQRVPVFPYLSTSWNTFLNGVKTSSGDLLNSNPAPMIHETSRYTIYYVQHSCIRTWCIRDTHYSASTVSKPCYSYVCTYLIECHLGMK